MTTMSSLHEEIWLVETNLTNSHESIICSWILSLPSTEIESGCVVFVPTKSLTNYLLSEQSPEFWASNNPEECRHLRFTNRREICTLLGKIILCFINILQTDAWDNWYERKLFIKLHQQKKKFVLWLRPATRQLYLSCFQESGPLTRIFNPILLLGWDCISP